MDKRSLDLKRIVPKDAQLVPATANKVFTGIIYDVYQWQQKLFDGSETTFEMLKRPDTIEILAIKNDKIIVLQEEQPGKKPYYAIPGGRHDVPGETELQAAKRELLEETGLTFAKWRLVHVHQPTTKIEHFIYQYLATDFVSQNDPHLEAGEKIVVLELGFSEVKQLAQSTERHYLPKDLLDAASSVNDLLNLSEFVGQEVDL